MYLVIGKEPIRSSSTSETSQGCLHLLSCDNTIRVKIRPLQRVELLKHPPSSILRPKSSGQNPWHSNGRCGPQNPLTDGRPGQCDPKANKNEVNKNYNFISFTLFLVGWSLLLQYRLVWKLCCPLRMPGMHWLQNYHCHYRRLYHYGWNILFKRNKTIYNYWGGRNIAFHVKSSISLIWVFKCTTNKELRHYASIYYYLSFLSNFNSVFF